MQESFFTDRGIYYRRNEYNADRQTLVFIHGVSGSSSAWLKYEDKFKDKYNILSLDLRGHGKSLKPQNCEDYKIELFVEDIYLLLQSLGINKCIIISHSFGSIIALSFLDKHQDIASKIILLSPQYSVNQMLSAKIIKPFIYGLAAILPKPQPRKLGTHIDYSKYLNTKDWNIPRTIADVRNTGIRIYLYCAKQTYDFDGQNILNRINIPTLIVHGRNDSIFPIKYAVDMNSKIKGSKMSVVEGSDHILVLNNFEEVSRIIEDFIKQN